MLASMRRAATLRTRLVQQLQQTATDQACPAPRAAACAWNASAQLSTSSPATSLWHTLRGAAAAVLPSSLRSSSAASTAARSGAGADPGQQPAGESQQQAAAQQGQQPGPQPQGKRRKGRRKRDKSNSTERPQEQQQQGATSPADGGQQAGGRAAAASGTTGGGGGTSASRGNAAVSSTTAVVSEAQAAFSSLPPALILQDDAHPIREADIARPAWLVLSRLRAAGHEAYMVGGTIRDLLLGGTPKDYDLLTSAELHQIKRLFSRCHVVGRSFPVCQVYTEGTMIEVSSFSTHADSQLIPADASSHMIGRQKSKRWSRETATWAEARAHNAARRDFTVNALLYDPFSRLLFDSVGGVADCHARRLRTICPPEESFQQDPARILRGVRLAARAGLEVEAGTAAAMEAQAPSISKLPQGRLQMEVGSLLGYGAAGASLALMWRLGLADMLLPQQALYLRRHRVPRSPRTASAVGSPPVPSSKSQRRNLLFDLAAELDRHVHPQRPVDPSVWVALLAAPLVADECATAMRKHSGKQRRSKKKAMAAAAAATAADEEQRRGADGGPGGSGGASGGGDEGFGRAQQVQHAQQRGPPGLVGWVSPEQAERQRYQERYSQVVSDVLDAMLQGLDSETMCSLGRQAKKHGEQLQHGTGRRHRARHAPPDAAQQGAPDAGGGGSEQPEEARQALLPCVLPRAAVDRAVSLLLLEADLRGRPELQPLLHRSGWAAANGAAGAGAAEGDDLPHTMGQHAEQHALWRRLERSVPRVRPSDVAAAFATMNPGSLSTEALAAVADKDEASRHAAGKHRRRHGGGRVLSAEERLVLGILSDPRFDFAAKTALPPA